ncbi:MAG: TRAP transporter large permease [Candidatus Aminicenantes bacterium]|nr:TRAP transporter large permease [Candidatus Aminicenantes bacterium]
MTIMVIVFFCLVVIKTPIGFSLLISSLVYFLRDGTIPLTIIAQKMISGPNAYALLAVPLFILSGNFMNVGGITTRIFRFARVLIGHVPGGLGQVNILASVIFSGMSGSANADAAGLGLIEINAMREAGYDEDYSIGVTSASSIIGPIIPPSVPAVLYAMVSSVSLGKLFVAGIIPGFVMALCIGIMAFMIAMKRGYKASQRATFKEILTAFIKAFPSLLTPVIIITGLWSGMFTATEVAAVTLIYALFLSTLVYKDLRLKDIPQVLYNSAYLSIPFIFIVATSMVFGWIIIREQAGQQLGNFILALTSNKYVILLILNIVLLILGTFMDPAVTILLLVPVLKPLLTTVQIDLLHFGIVMILNLMIGLLTPPVGSVLNTLTTVADIPMEMVIKATMKFLLPLIISLLLITFIPQLVLFLPNLLFK